MTKTSRPTFSYQRNAWLAMLALLGFVALYAATCGWLLTMVWRFAQGVHHHRDATFSSGFTAAVALFLAVFLLKALFFVKRGAPKGQVEITPDQQPRLFAFLHALADRVGAPRPHRVFLSARVNAAVFYDLNILNLLFPSRKNLEIGLGLVNTLDLTEFEAVCAHEFGHFAQRTMAVGRWVYLSQQIAGHIVAKRDALDRFLSLGSRVDFRIAWIAWLLKLLVWALRSVVDTFFTVVTLAQRSLSREMEMQADLVAVSVTGSDALVLALHRLQAADDAWDRALGFVGGQLARKRAPRDIFAIQTRVLENMRVLLDDPAHGATPLPPDGDPAGHRIFSAGLAQPPRMWATHPHNHVREENAKRDYVPSTLDTRSAWTLFEAPEALRETLTRGLYQGPELPPCDTADALADLDRQFGREHLRSAYRGVYYGHSPVRAAASPRELYGPLDGAEADLDRLYPPSLKENLERLVNLAKEKALLENLRDGHLEAATLAHRGRPINARELPAVIQAVATEEEEAQAVIAAHMRVCRTAHRAAAAALGGGWEARLVGLAGLLHYADHALANLLDARRFLSATLALETAGGPAGKDGANAILFASGGVYAAMEGVFKAMNQVALDADLLAALEAESWPAVLGELRFPAPALGNLNDWIRHVDSWADLTASALDRLRIAALDELLQVEGRVAAWFREGAAPGEAPPPPSFPDRYPVLSPGMERRVNRKLSLWERILAADGFLPATLRLAAAVGIIGALLGVRGQLAKTSLGIQNGLDRAVIVKLGDRAIFIPPHGTASLDLVPYRRYSVAAETREGVLIERFEASLEEEVRHGYYNVAGAAALVEWTAVYGRGQADPERLLGAARWGGTPAEDVFTKPPEQLNTSEGTTRRVLTALAAEGPELVVGMLQDPRQREALIAAHARWDAPDGRDLPTWLAAARNLPGLRAILDARLKECPTDMGALRAEQDLEEPGPARDRICAARLQQVRPLLEEGNWLYLQARAAPEGTEGALFLEAFARFPRNRWLTLGAGYTYADRRQWAEAQKCLAAFQTMGSGAVSYVDLDLARIRRAAGDGARLKDLAARTPSLQNLLRFEGEEDPKDPEARAYANLGKGRLDQALAHAKGLPGEARLLRLAAASEGATAAMIAHALALPMDQGLDNETVIPALALAQREGADPTACKDVLTREVSRYAPQVLRFLDLAKAGKTAEAERSLGAMSPFLLGQCYAGGTVLLGRKAPPAWRQGATRLLFRPERPYFN